MWDKILNIISTIVLMISLVIICISLYSRYNSVSVLGYQFLCVQSDSMSPVFDKGDLILCKKGNKNYEVGDIVTFKTYVNGIAIKNTHRIVSKEIIDQVTYYSTKGDNALANDEGTIINEDILYKYTGKHIPYLGYFIDFINTKNGIFLCIVFPMFLWFIYNLYHLFKELRLAYKKA